MHYAHAKITKKKSGLLAMSDDSRPIRKGGTMATHQDFPVFEVLGEVESLLYRCPECGEKIRVLAGELNKKHHCPKCDKQFETALRPLGSIVFRETFNSETKY